jgi:hypothetical protein
VRKLAFLAIILLSQTALAQLDSLKISVPSLKLDTLTVLTNKLDSIEASARGRIDSVTQYYNQATATIQGLTSRYQQKIDSLSHLKLPTEKYTKKLDSLSNKVAEVKQKLEGKIQSIKQQATEKLNSIPLPPELQTKVSELTGSLDKLSLSGLTSGINSPIDLKGINTSLDQIIPSTDLKEIANISTDLPGVDIPNVNMPDVSKNLGSVSNLTAGVSEQASTLQKGAGEITQGVSQANNLDKLAESQITKLDGVKDLTGATGSLPNLMTSEEEAKKLALDQAKQAATDHFAGKEEVLKSAMEKISKYKQKFSSINSLSEITKRPPNPMKGKPLVERIVPGIQFQIFQKQGNFVTDFNLYAGYKINGRLTAGIGWNHRVAYNMDLDEFNPKARIFGPRAFGEFKIGRGFSPRAEVEIMNMLIPPYISNARADEGTREWVVSGLVGIKKEYKFYKNVKGTTMLMLNVLHPHNKSPYPDWLNVRFGFEFPLKKKALK